MKYKFKKDGKELQYVEIDGFIYVLENRAVDNKEYFYDFDFPLLGVRVSRWSAYEPDIKRTQFPVIFTNNPALTDVPQFSLEEDVSNATQKFLKDSGQLIFEESPLLQKILKDEYTRIFSTGYNKAKETYKYTEEDIKAAFEEGINAQFESHHLKTFHERDTFRQAKLKKFLEQQTKVIEL